MIDSSALQLKGTVKPPFLDHRRYSVSVPEISIYEGSSSICALPTAVVIPLKFEKLKYILGTNGIKILAYDFYRLLEKISADMI